jgi:peptide/nickel transport system substrate-binding protein
MTLRINKDIISFDPELGIVPTSIYMSYMEQLLTTDWTMDPKIQNYQLSYWDSTYEKGQLAQSWEFTSPGTMVLHLRQGISWQNLPPANGREFTANDVVFHFNRMMGLGNGFTTPAPYLGTNSAWAPLTSITATDKYTVVMKWNTPNPEVAIENMTAPACETTIENPEAVQQWGNLNDWHHAVGTGPFILTDFVSGSSATLIKNTNYWGYDERYPKNKLPYVDKITYLIIPDDATALAALRTGKIDDLDSIPYNQAQAMQKTNPEIVDIGVPIGNTVTMDPRNDKAPFNDIRVREALQMSIDLSTIAKSYYGGAADPWPSTLTSNYMTGWGLPYNQWPQDLKDQYAYNPTVAKQLLTAAGYPSGFNTDVVADNSGDMDLLQVIKSYYAAIGVVMDIRPMDSGTFASFAVTGHKQDALIQRQPGAGSLGLTYYPLRQILRFQTGYSVNTALVSDPKYDVFPPKTTASTSTDDLKAIMKDANLYVAQQHYVISLLQQMQYSLCQPWLKGYNGQYAAFYGPSGPLLLFFYGARFWIDQNQKKSMGH